MNEKYTFPFINGLRANAAGYGRDGHLWVSTYPINTAWQDGWDYYESWKNTTRQPPDTLEGQLLQHVADEAWHRVLNDNGNQFLSFRLAQWAEFMIEKLRGSAQNDISFVDRVAYLKQFGLDTQ